MEAMEATQKPIRGYLRDILRPISGHFRDILRPFMGNLDVQCLTIAIVFELIYS